MDLITQTSLEALLQKATSSQTQSYDTAALEAFSTLINKEKDGALIGTKVIASRIHCGLEKEVLQTLNILDICMRKCGTHFQAEVGKFRFLNEMIKLVSPKYEGKNTPFNVKVKVIQLMYAWTFDYPKEGKIREAFEMLRKQGVIHPLPNLGDANKGASETARRGTDTFLNEEKSKKLQKLLQSRDPADIESANLLIKSMVKEEDRKAEIKSKRDFELQSVKNNLQLLSEMLDCYTQGVTSKDEIDLMTELYQSCERLTPNIIQLATESYYEDLGNIIQVTNDLKDVITRYKSLNLDKKSNSRELLDLCANLAASTNFRPEEDSTKNKTSDLDVLRDIFSMEAIPDKADVLKPISMTKNDLKADEKNAPKLTGLEELDALGENLIKENLNSAKNGVFPKANNDKTPLNLLSNNKAIDTKEIKKDPLDIDINFLLKPVLTPKNNNASQNLENDDVLVDLNDGPSIDPIDTPNDTKENPQKNLNKCDKSLESKKFDFKLNDISVDLKSIKPSSVAPLTILSDKNGLTVTLHFAKDKPRADVQVFVVTAISKNELPVSNYLFQALVPKGCKVKLQPPSDTCLPSFNPFLPPSAITQIMLISNPEEMDITLKFVASFIMDDDTFTEMGEVHFLPKVT